jgi:hypothetical protein
MRPTFKKEAILFIDRYDTMADLQTYAFASIKKRVAVLLKAVRYRYCNYESLINKYSHIFPIEDLLR